MPILLKDSTGRWHSISSPVCTRIQPLGMNTWTVRFLPTTTLLILRPDLLHTNFFSATEFSCLTKL